MFDILGEVQPTGEYNPSHGLTNIPDYEIIDEGEYDE